MVASSIPINPVRSGLSLTREVKLVAIGIVDGVRNNSKREFQLREASRCLLLMHVL